MQPIKKKLSKTLVANAIPKEKRYYISDTDVPQFRLSIWPTGHKAYVLDYRMGKGREAKKRRLTIGAANKLSVEQARDLAKKALAKVINGNDPRAEELRRANKHSFKTVWQKYINEYVKIKNKPSTQRSIEERGRRLILPYFKNRDVEDITHKDIAVFMQKMISQPTDANRCRAHLSKMFNLCEIPWEIKLLNSNPCKGVPCHPENRRERFLSDDELRRLMAVLNNLIQNGLVDYQAKPKERTLYRIRVACYFKLMLFTGARGIEWRITKIKDIDIARMILFADTKNNAPAITLTPEAMEVITLLLELPRSEDNPYLFPGVLAPCMAYPKKLWGKIREEADITDFKAHDSRHTWAAYALAGGLNLADVGNQLNHKTYQTTKRYEHLALEVKKKNASIASHLINSVGHGSKDSVDAR